jgi:hypothetical protein
MAAELDERLGRPRSIREDHFGYWSSYGAWWGRHAGGVASQNVVQSLGATPTQLEGPTTPGQLSVTARVTVSFELE